MHTVHRQAHAEQAVRKLLGAQHWGHEREMLLPTSSHSNKLISGRPTDARRPEPYKEEGNVQKNQTKPNQQANG